MELLQNTDHCCGKLVTADYITVLNPLFVLKAFRVGGP
jgi:hypothetical protein